MRELIKLSAVLIIICCGASLSLALVYRVTKEPIAYQQHLKKIRAVNAVFPQFEDSPGITARDTSVCDDAADACRQVYILTGDADALGTAFEVSSSGYGGEVDIMIGVNPDKTISGVSIVSHSETPGLGANITRESFTSQFAGKRLSGTGLTLTKDGGEIDQVSGATISSAAVVDAVRGGLRFYDDRETAIKRTIDSL